MIALPRRLAVTSELTTNELSESELAQLAAAAAVHNHRDLAPAWPHAEAAVVQAFPDPSRVPAGYDPLTIVDVADMPPGALGFHHTEHRQPAARIGLDPARRADVSITLTHEADELCVDPSGNRLVIADVPEPDGGFVRARVLVEVADPPEAFAYTVDGLQVSDFVHRSYYGPHRGWTSTSLRPYSYLDVIAAPLTVARGGYLSYKVGHEWRQITWFGDRAPAVRVLGHEVDRLLENPRSSIKSYREAIDHLTQGARVVGHLGLPSEAERP